MDNKIIFIIAILWFVFFAKQMLFWFWLWQLKEYHWGRFKAHFETQGTKKVLSSIWRFKYPKPTKKILAIIAYSLLLEWAIWGRFLRLNSGLFYLALVLSLILAPVIASLIVLLFEMPAVVLRNKLLEKARQKRKQFKDLVVIGITGSYGKTSVKEFLYAILSEKFRVLKTPSHINAEVGIARTIIRELKPEHQIFIAEIGAYERGKISEVCWMLQPKIGILTGINEQHMSTFGSQENIMKAKFELIESLPKNGFAIFNGANKYCRALYGKTAIPKIITSSDSNTFSTIVEKVLLWDKENFLMAAAAAQYLGMTFDEIAKASQKIKNSIEIKSGFNGTKVIDSAYSANPDSVISHLEYFKGRGEGKIIVMPCLIELGSSSKKIHQRIGESIGQVCDLAIITTNDRFEDIRDGALRSGMLPDKIVLIENPKKILQKLKVVAKPGDIILLEGRVSKQIIKGLL
ncbi:MAG: UDP-N-acetylmuramoyl-tripeptide--D-alanyl-D-alanine ligase [Patescibacteria group bacterium]